MAVSQKLGRVGIWSMELRFGDQGSAPAGAAELEALGFPTIWIPGGVGGDIKGAVDNLLGATEKAVIATGIINIWMHEPEEIADWWKAMPTGHQERVLLGLGVSHGPLIGDRYTKPLAAMHRFVDRVTELGVPAQSLCVAALGPKMLELSRDKTAGAHPYLVSVEHSEYARGILGPDALLAPEQGVILESDPERARALGRGFAESYRKLPNYVNNWLRQGISQADIDSFSDDFVDRIFAWGPDQIAARVDAHIAAGANHVCLQVITGNPPGSPAPLVAWRELAKLLG